MRMVLFAFVLLGLAIALPVIGIFFADRRQHPLAGFEPEPDDWWTRYPPVGDRAVRSDPWNHDHASK